MNRHSLFFLLLFLIPLSFLQKVVGQQNDFQFWPSVELNLEVIKDLKIQVKEEARFRENCTQISRQINEIGLSYKINKFFKAALFYRMEADWKNPDDYVWRNGFFADATFRYEPGRFTLGYRLRLHSSKIELNEKQAQWFDGIRSRHKITAEYNIKGIPLSPYAEGELFSGMAGSHGSSLWAYRAWAGFKYTLNKTHEFDLKYGIDQELNVPDPLRAYIVALGYTLNLKMQSVK